MQPFILFFTDIVGTICKELRSISTKIKSLCENTANKNRKCIIRQLELNIFDDLYKFDTLINSKR